ncbi:MAG: ABC transporter permease [Planctomycetaceae bacterium]
MSISRAYRTINLALKSLMLHKLRSGLTMLGIVFGVFSVIAMLAIGEGASAQAQKQVLELGATNIICVSVKPPQESVSQQGNSFMLRYGLLRSDYELLSNTLSTVTKAIPIREVVKEVRFLHRSMKSRIVGCTADYAEITRLAVAQGRFIAATDQRKMNNVCVLASETADTLFPYEDPLGSAIQIGSIKYLVVGVTKSRSASAAIGGSLSGQDFNKDVYIPLQTFYVRMGDQNIQRGSGSFSAETVELNQITLQISHRDEVIKTAEVVRESLEQRHVKKDYSIVVPMELLKQADQLRMIFNVVLGSIAAISLVVGGIGIMNIMLATVTERTREIGIRRALGATQRDITAQFLTETMVLSGTGGVFGVLLGIATPVAFWGIQAFVNAFVLYGQTAGSELGKIFSDMEPQIALWSLPLAFGISVGIGIMFGLYPAKAAARLDPIEALRHE